MYMYVRLLLNIDIRHAQHALRVSAELVVSIRVAPPYCIFVHYYIRYASCTLAHAMRCSTFGLAQLYMQVCREPTVGAL